MNRAHASAEELKKRFEEDHQHPVNRALHRVGFVVIAAGIPTALFRPGLGLGLIGAGYGLNFLGHAIEGTVPVLLRDPRAVILGARHFGSELRSMLRGASKDDHASED